MDAPRSEKNTTPTWYELGDGLQVLDVIDLFCEKLDKSRVKISSKDIFYLGNIFKYLFRHPYKGVAIDDLRKAQHYLTLLVENHEGKLRIN